MKSETILHYAIEQALNCIDEGLHVVDKEGKTIYYNNAIAEIDGLSREQVLNRKVSEMFPSLNHDTSTLLKVLATGEAIYDAYQTYTNIKGEKVTTLNTTLPVVVNGQLVGAVEISKNITRIKQLSERILDLQQQIIKKKSNPSQSGIRLFGFSDIIGVSNKIRKSVALGKLASKTSSTVLIYGETGTGKELFAQSIHSDGIRKHQPFISQNCAALPESLLEGILFGTVKGGFTGAVDRPGLFEQADGGTLLLDEINSMGMGLQAKMLRVLQEGYIRRVGDTKEIPVDVRIIATTNIDPFEAVKQGSLRQDLFYRLNVVSMVIPPLRERKEDIMLLARSFLKHFSVKLNKKVSGISGEVERILLNYSWPGNVRELKNTIESAMNLVSPNDELSIEHLPAHVTEQPLDTIGIQENLDTPLSETLENIEFGIIAKALKEAGGNITRTAACLGMTRQALQYKLKKYNLR
jgi:arginine utilization regulatory protein